MHNQTFIQMKFPSYPAATFLPIFFCFGFLHDTWASAPVSIAMQSPNRNITVVLHYEDVSKVAETQTRLQTHLPILELLFNELIAKKQLDAAYPKLMIIARKQYSVESRLEHGPTSVTYSQQTQLVCNNPDFQQFEPISLEPAYVIETTFGMLQMPDLLALMISLSDLCARNSLIEIYSEEQLARYQQTRLYRQLYQQQWVYANEAPFLKNMFLKTTWSGGKTCFEITDDTQNTLLKFAKLQQQLTPISWIELNDNQSFVAMANDRNLFLANLQNGEKFFQELIITPEENHTLHRVDFYHQPAANQLLAIAKGAFNQALMVYGFDPAQSQWSALHEGLPLYALTDSVFNWQITQQLVSLLPVQNITITRNATAVVESPLDGIGPTTNQRGFTPRTFFLIGIIIVAIGVWLFFKKRQKMGIRDGK
ncbi:MAG TPA: hypothetical protein DCM62_07505 [Bacteroidales bacterium]|nr:hypothetical protein [Bacteroidales bacterium]